MFCEQHCLRIPLERHRHSWKDPNMKQLECPNKLEHPGLFGRPSARGITLDTPSPPGIELGYRIKAINDRRTSRVVEAEGNPELLRETWGF